jgi:AraC-like DNA-binding protein
MIESSPDVLQTKNKANMLYTRLLEFVRCGDTAAIEGSLASPGYAGLTGLMLGSDFDFAMTVMQFLSPQIARAAIDGGMGELAAADIYLEYMQSAKTATTGVELLALHQKMLVDFAGRVETLKAKEPLSPLIAQCNAYIAQHVNESLTASEVARALHVSRGYLAHCYKKETGTTVKSRILEEKLAIARILLGHSELGIAELSAQLGFSSQSRFTDLFKKSNGTTPLKYRKTKAKAQNR